MTNHKNKKPKGRRSSCKLCKPHKRQEKRQAGQKKSEPIMTDEDYAALDEYYSMFTCSQCGRESEQFYIAKNDDTYKRYCAPCAYKKGYEDGSRNKGR